MDFVQKNSVLHSSICRREELPGRSVKVKVIRWYYLHLSGVKRGNAWHIFLKSSEKEGKAHKITDFFKHVDNILNQTEQILFTFHYLCVPELNRYYSHSITCVFQIHLALRTSPATLPAKLFAPTTPSCWPAHQGEATLWARWCGIVTTNVWTHPLQVAATRPSTSTHSPRCRQTMAWSTAVRWPIWWRQPPSPIASHWLCIVSSSQVHTF